MIEEWPFLQGFLYFFMAILGLYVGSFCNVLIVGLPGGKECLDMPSRCIACGRRLQWHERIPVVGWLLQRGRCQSCGVAVSVQYPVVELVNSGVWVVTFLLLSDDPIYATLCCGLFSTLLVLSVLDWRTFEIPNSLNLTVFLLGLAWTWIDRPRWMEHVIGMGIVSIPFLLLWLVTGGRGIGMGDIKLTAAGGLLLGWKQMLPAIFTSCWIGTLFHLIRMRHGAGHKLAFGPYLALGIWLFAVAGEPMMGLYFALFGSGLAVRGE